MIHACEYLEATFLRIDLEPIERFVHNVRTLDSDQSVGGVSRGSETDKTGNGDRQKSVHV